MRVTKRSIISGKESTIDLPVTWEQVARWQQGTPVQDAFPHLTSDQREFLLTGITPEEWKQSFGDDPEEEEVP